MMRIALLLCLTLLMSCARPAPPAPTIYRDLAAPIGSTTRGGLTDLSGDWIVAAAYPGGPDGGPGQPIIINATGPASGTLQLGGSSVPVTVGLPGRLRDVANGTEYWVIWVDDDFRTAVIGTPTGDFGWIMDRPGQASADRLVAAREILDFSGYDLSRLQQ